MNYQLNDDWAESMVTGSMIRDLQKICSSGVTTDVRLADLSRWQIGGKAKVLIKPSTPDEIVELRKYFARNGLPHVVIGMTTNLLFDDRGLFVPCVQVGSRLGRLEYNAEENYFNVEAGVWVPQLARSVMLHGFTGAEHTCGIPGTIGGLICMNGGSQRKGIGEAVVKVHSVDKEGAVVARSAAECQFGYRESVYQFVDEIIIAAQLRFDKAESKSEPRQRMLSILADRRKKFPQKQPNCGSVFKSNPIMYDSIGAPGKVLEELGYKGKRKGGAAVSDKHANFIVNLGAASSRDVLELICELYMSVYDATGYRMVVEAKFVDPTGNIREILCATRPGAVFN